MFNTLQVSWIDHDVHLTFFTSTGSPHNAETVWEEIRDDVVVVAIARAASVAASTGVRSRWLGDLGSCLRKSTSMEA